MARTEPEGPPRIESLSVRNFRALRKIDLKDLTPLTVLIGPNGSGKSTVFDVFAFLSAANNQMRWMNVLHFHSSPLIS